MEIWTYIFLGIITAFIAVLVTFIIMRQRDSHARNNLDVIQRISNDSRELREKIIKELGGLRSELTNKISTENSELQLKLAKELSQSNEKLNHDFQQLTKDLNEQMRIEFGRLITEVEKDLNKINEKVNERLDTNFKDTNKTVMQLTNRIEKIDSAQKKIEELSTNIIDLQSVLTDKKTRGIFGEVQLKHILTQIFGETSHLYTLQKRLTSGHIVDCVVHAPEPMGMISIDSKFPLENYNRMINKNAIDNYDEVVRQFKRDIRKHIDDIASKYIIPNETATQAIMFLPAEAIFAELYAHHNELVEYGYKNKVFIASPSTLIASITVIQATIREIEIHQNAKIVQSELNKLSEDFRRFKERWGKLNKNIDSVTNVVKELNTSQDKIDKSFVRIKEVRLPDKTNNGQRGE